MFLFLPGRWLSYYVVNGVLEFERVWRGPGVFDRFRALA